MLKSNSQIRQEALASLKGRWGAAIALCFIYCVLVALVSFIPVVGAVSFLVALPLMYGVAIWFLAFFGSTDGSIPPIKAIFDGFNDYLRILVTLVLMGVYTFLWTLLLIVPGIIKSLSYSLTTYILAENPELSNNAAIELSMAMMKGNKMKLFLMQLNFLLWSTLSVFTFGIGMLWVLPYMQTTMVSFYQTVKEDYQTRIAI